MYYLKTNIYHFLIGGPQPGNNNKTAQISAVPRTKVKVSGGTQTCSSDLQPHSKFLFSFFHNHSIDVY